MFRLLIRKFSTKKPVNIINKFNQNKSTKKFEGIIYSKKTKEYQKYKNDKEYKKKVDDWIKNSGINPKLL